MDVSPLTFVAIVYWLALAAWVGAALFVIMAAPVIFRVVGEADPTLPTVLSVNLEGQHSTLLAARVVANLLAALARIEFWAGMVIALCLAAEWVSLLSNSGGGIGMLALRSGLFLVAIAFGLYGSRVIRPRAEVVRQEYVDNADEPEIANPALERFDALHRESVTFLLLTLVCLVGLVAFSAADLAEGPRQTISFSG